MLRAPGQSVAQAVKAKQGQTAGTLPVVSRRASRSPRADVIVQAQAGSNGQQQPAHPTSPRSKVVPNVAAVEMPLTEQMEQETYAAISGSEIVRRFFQAVNARDISGILNLVADDIVHHDLSYEQPATSQLGVARFYSDLIASLSHNMVFVVEEITSGDPHKVGVTWRMEVEGSEVPLGKGLSFYRINSRGRINYVRQSPEHFIKCAHVAQGVSSMASPLVGALGAAALPSFWSNVANAAGAAVSNLAAAPAASALGGASPTDFLQGLMAMASTPSSGMSMPGFPFMDQGSMAPPGASTSFMGHAPSAPSHASHMNGAAPRASPATPRGDVSTAAAAATAVVVGVGRQQGEMVEADSTPATTSANNVVSYRDAPRTATTTATTPGLSEGSADEEPRLATADDVTASTGAAAGPMYLSGVKPSDLQGLWVKIPEESELEAYERCLDLWQISGIQKQTAKLIEGLEIQTQGTKFNVHFLTIIPMFKVTEAYDLARPTKVMRRDLRQGDAHATAANLDAGVMVTASFGAPFTGVMEERYELRQRAGHPDEIEMAVTSGIKLPDGRSEKTTQIYRRQQGIKSKQDFIKQSERKNGKPNDILKQFGMPV